MDTLKGQLKFCQGKMLLLLSGATRSQATYPDPYAFMQASQWLESITFNNIRNGHGLRRNLKRLIGNTLTCPSNPRPIIINLAIQTGFGILRHTGPIRTILRGTVPRWALSKLRSQGNWCPPHALPQWGQNPSPHGQCGQLKKWMETDGCTDPELIYWIPKYILMRNNKPFSHMGHMSAKMHALAACWKSRQNRMEKYHGRLHIVPLL